jgi:hypothetical protein
MAYISDPYIFLGTRLPKRKFERSYGWEIFLKNPEKFNIFRSCDFPKKGKIGGLHKQF